MLGFASAVVDNVPLVAAAQGMYDLDAHPVTWSWRFKDKKKRFVLRGNPWKNDAKIATIGMFDSEKEWIRVYFESNKGLVGMSGVPYNPDGSFFLRHARL